ncbi:MAG TPA: flagellar hook-associated protein FlgK [Arcobacter sp.]|nr:flagellar hook-associated protein FlgK [Arcobacter sp.]HIP56384.1 flagellar hook-associated protein FlgK [Arcobacter sp.]
MLNTLNVAQSGLTAAHTQVENVMNNIANENTAGYKKRVVSVTESEHSDSRVTGRGVTVGSVDRVTNIYMYDRLIDEQSKSAQYSELSTMLSDIESIFYETEDSGLSNDLDKYFQAIENLRSNPYNEIYRNNLANQGQILVDDIQTLYKGISDREAVTTNFIDDNVGEINGILNDIGAVNKQISDEINPSNDLLDKRDALESRLSEYISIDVNREDTYSLSIGGMTAVRYNTNVHAIEVIKENNAQKDIYSNINNTSNLVNTNWDDSSTPKDSITYTYDKDNSITITAGDSFVDTDGNTQTVTKDNIVQALTSKINNDPVISLYVEAHNGQYSLDDSGNKIELAPQTTDHYLMVESKITGTSGSFESRITVNNNDTVDANANQILSIIDKNSVKSIKADNDIHFEIFGEELDISGGTIKSMLDNIDTTSTANKFEDYKDMLNNFAKALADISHSYIDKGDGTYISGEIAGLKAIESDRSQSQTIGLFSGATVETLTFNKAVVSNLSQSDLDYLATSQWNSNIDIDGTGDNETSFTKYLQKIKVTISADKENADYARETQIAVTQALTGTYDKLTKVNKDDEMINLIKFQSAYEANAKLITIVDEMLATILGMR